MSGSPFRLPIVLGSLAAFAATAFAAGSSSPASKISPDLANSSSRTAQPVIIQYYNPPSPVETGLLGLVGGLLKTVLGSINAIVANVLPSQLNLLAADPNVKYISLDRPLGARGAGNITTAEFTTEPINAPAVWEQGYKGTNIGVAVIDSGITPVPDLAPNSVSCPLGQPIRHATAGIGEGSGALEHRAHRLQPKLRARRERCTRPLRPWHARGGTDRRQWQPVLLDQQYFRTFRGSAPNANLINLRVLDQNGAGTDSVGDCGDPAGDFAEEHVQHPRDQSFPGSSNLRKLYARPAVPGRRTGVEGRHRGGCRRRQRWPRSESES